MGDFRWALLIAGGALILLIYGWTLWRHRQRRAEQIWRDTPLGGKEADWDDAPAVRRGRPRPEAAPESASRRGRRVSDPDDPAPDALLAELSSLGRLMHEEASTAGRKVTPVPLHVDKVRRASEHAPHTAIGARPVQDNVVSNAADRSSATASAESPAAATPVASASAEVSDTTDAPPADAVAAQDDAACRDAPVTHELAGDASTDAAAPAAARPPNSAVAQPAAPPTPAISTASTASSVSLAARRRAVSSPAAPSGGVAFFKKWGWFRRQPPVPAPTPRLPELILVLYVVAKPATTFAGPVIREALEHVGLQPGLMAVYHRMPVDEESGKPVFSVADMLEPGHLQPDTLDDHSTPGLSIFMRLPGAVDGQAAFEDMYQSCCQIAQLLQGELRDEQRCVLTRQTVDHLRERIIEWRRQTQLARLKQGAEPR